LQFGHTPKLLVVGVRAHVQHFAYDIVQDLLGDGAEELVAGDLPGVEVDPREFRVVIKNFLKVGCTIRYAWCPAGGPACADRFALESGYKLG
jgi:hypothetical protein